MDTKFLTPIQLWKDFNPVKDSLEISLVSSEIKENTMKRALYYTSETIEENKVRIYTEIISVNDNKKKPAIIILGDLDNPINRKAMDYVANNGYTAVGIDYCGKEEFNENYSKFPESLKYATYQNAKDNLYEVNDVSKSCWFVWAKAIRRLVTLLYQDKKIDVNNIGVIGIKDSALLMYHVCAMDGRINAGVSVLGNEGVIEKFDNQENLVNFKGGLSADTYARFLNCPVLIASSSNSKYTSIDKIDEIVSLIPENISSAKSITPRLGNHITNLTLSTIKKWVSSILKKGKEILNPTLDIRVKENKINIKIIPDESKKIKSIKLYYSYGENDSSLRNWIDIEIDKTKLKTNIDVYNSEVRHYVFANVVYSDKIELSTKEYDFIPADYDIEESTFVRQRIVYDSSEGLDSFTIDSENLLIEDNPRLSKCPEGINGLLTTEGNLVTYKVGDIRCFGDEDSILQLNAFTQEETLLIVCLKVKEKDKLVSYYAQAEIQKEKWNRVSFNQTDFKTKDLIPLKDWCDIKKLEILNAKDILFNNIIWV